MLASRIPKPDMIEFSPHYLRAKRILDVIFTLLMLPLLGVVMAIIALLIRLDSDGPVFFRQKRIGQNGVVFEILKFRSMYINTDDSTHRQAIEQYMNGKSLNGEAENDMMFKLYDDPRVTRIGRVIRKMSLDELPQFFNVLQGTMTLVGPRPPLPYEVELYSACHMLRLCGKPGLTGPWQVYGRSRVPFGDMVEMDIAYLQQQSIWLDLKLIFLTIPVMMLGRGGA
jgi:lipopolysaccharide/colanic/teichoic acid biosynthesis glycosyltransferase